MLGHKVNMGCAAIKQRFDPPALFAAMRSTSVMRRSGMKQAAHQPRAEKHENDYDKRDLL
jgi:hypothetical protein